MLQYHAYLVLELCWSPASESRFPNPSRQSKLIRRQLGDYTRVNVSVQLTATKAPATIYL